MCIVHELQYPDSIEYRYIFNKSLLKIKYLIFNQLLKLFK